MNQHVDDLLPFYINATLPEDQSEAVEAHLADCLQCREALREWEELAVWLRPAAPLTEQGAAAASLPALSPVVQANLRGKPSFAEGVLSTARLIAVQRIFLKESRLFQILSGVLLASVLADLFMPGKDRLPSSVPLIILVPFLAVLGVGFFESREDDYSHEIIAATPTPPGVLTFARLTLALGFTTGLALVCSLVISAFSGASLGPLVAAWLGPLLWLPALATLLALLMNPWTAAGVSVTLWGGLGLLLATEGYGRPLLGFSLAPLLYPSWWSFGLQALLGGLLWLICWLRLFWGGIEQLKLSFQR